MEKCIINLKQHTPMIHFQEDEEGTTLRASELKPKLDKFLIDNFKRMNDNLDEKDIELLSFLKMNIDKKLPSIYKMKILLKGENKKVKLKGTSYFGKIEDGIQSSNVSVEINCFDRNILKLLKIALRQLLVIENFGTRQTKGFGSFLPIDMKKIEFEEILKKYSKKNGEIKIYRKKVIEPLKSINKDYQKLKSGVSYEKPYKKSPLHKIKVNNIDLHWEKRKIKKELKLNYVDCFENLKDTTKSNENNYLNSNKNNEEYRFFRAMLGLPTAYVYLTNDEKVNYIFAPLDISEEKIERFSSPLKFKVFEDQIYIISLPIPLEIRNKKFEFSFKEEIIKNNTEKSINVKKNDFFSINTPSKEEFNLIEFLDNELPKIGFENIEVVK